MLKLSVCPTCGSKNIRKVRRTLTETFQGKTYTIPKLDYYECPDCGEQVFDREAMRKIEANVSAARKPGKKKVA